MNNGQIVFSQIMDYFPRRRFKSCVDRYRGDHRVKTFTCLDQFYCMTFAQLTSRESLRDIKAFYGTTPNAVKTQVWIAISVYVLVAILKKELDLQTSMYEILQVLGVMLFEKTPVKSLFYADFNNFSKSDMRNQLYLFDL